MSARIALCVDEATVRNPETVGLDGEKLEEQSWLKVFLTGDEARTGIDATGSFDEAWVVSSEDIDPINLAATLKADHPDLCVRLVEFEGCGSLFSRARTALIDEVANQALFLRRYADAKRRYSTSLVQSAPVEACSANRDASGFPPIACRQLPESRAFVQSTTTLPPTVKAGRAFLMPVVSGSGGAGKSSVSVMGAFIARALGYRTLLLDYDLQFGDADILAGAEGALAVDEALAHPDQLDRHLGRDQGLTVLAAPARLETAEEVVRAIPQLLDDVACSFDVIIANTGAAWAEQHAALLERCSTALFLIDQRASSVRACKHALELCARCGIASGPFQFAVNRCAKNAPLTSSDVSCALQGAPVFEIKDGGRDVEDYLGGGAPTELLETHNEFCTSLEYVMGRLLPGASQRVDERAVTTDGKRSPKRRGRHTGRKRGWGAS